MVDLPAFNIVDAVVGVILLMGLLGGLKRGLSGELSRMLAIVLAGLAGWKFAQPCADWAVTQLGFNQERGYLFAFGLIAVVALIALWLLRRVLQNVIQFAFKGRIERVGGALCGLARAGAIAAFLLLALTFAPLPEVRTLVTGKSFFGRAVEKHVRPLYIDLREHRPELGLPVPTPPAAESDLGEMSEPEPGPAPVPEPEPLPVSLDTPAP